MATRQGFLRNLRDAAMLVTFTGPTGGTGGTGVTGVASSPSIDLDALTPQGERPQGLELVIRNPVLTGGATGNMQDAGTVTLTIENDGGTGFTGPSVLGTLVLTSNTGAPAGELRVGVVSNTLRYVRAKVAVHGGDESPVTFDFGVVT
jgi:hypothetical protein